MSPCPPRDQIEKLLAEQLDGAAVATVERHVDECPRCQALLAVLTAESLPIVAPTDAEWAPGSEFLERLRSAGDDRPSTHPQASTDTVTAGPELPTVVGYELLRVLGRGGMGIVYEAIQTRLSRRVALKMLRGDDEQFTARLRREAAAVARLQHPNIVQIFEVGEHAGRPFLALELVNGGSLAQHLGGQPQPPSAAAGLIETLAHAIQHAHDHGVIHRDLKPANVLLAQNPQPTNPNPQTGNLNWDFGVGPWGFSPKVSDFGLAKYLDAASIGLTETGQIMGTPGYMAPEQARGNVEVGAAADVYALGAILYECLTGRPPFWAATSLDAVLQLLAEEPVAPRRLNPTVPLDLETVCLKCLEKEPRRRYLTAAALSADLRRYLEGKPILARPVGPAGRTWRWVKRQPALSAAIATALLALIAGTAVATVKWRQAVGSERAARLAGQRAGVERDVARAVQTFFQSDLLLQASSIRQANTQYAPTPNLTLREALDRAAQQIPGKFDDNPLVEAGIRQTIGDAYRELGQYAAAETHLERALDLYRRELPADDVRAVDAINSLGLLRMFQARYDDAERLFLQARGGYDRILGVSHGRAIQTRLDLASAAMGRSRFSEAEAWHREALELCRRFLPPEDLVAENVVLFMALFHSHLGDFAKATELCHPVHDSRLRRYGPDHIATAQVAQVLAGYVVEVGGVDEADQLLAAAHAVWVKTVHPDSLQMFTWNAVSARVAQLRGDRTKAEQLLVAALKSSIAHFGAEHPGTISLQFRLAVLHNERREFQKADELFRTILAVQERVQGPKHVETLRTVASYAGNCVALGQLEKAEELCLRALEGWRAILGPLTPHTADAQQNLANLLAIRGKLAQAVELMTPVLEFRRSHDGTDLPSVANALRALAVFHQDLGRLAEAEGMFRELLEISRKAAGKISPADAPYQLGQNLVNQDRCSEAEPLLRESLTILADRKSQSFVMPHIKSLLGHALMRQAKYADAEPLLLAGRLELVEKTQVIPPHNRVWIQRAGERIVQLYEAWGKPEQAAQWRTKLAADKTP